ncbi:hypothetical protein [Rhodococcus sp. ACT016]|uniref:hypothetical protein n=1 Tax=Rhodococcus sp. ACT016 TaxID=3134808 RepID=UPI003D278B89
MAAVIGREFDTAVLESASDIDGEALLERIEPALLEGLVSEVATSGICASPTPSFRNPTAVLAAY